MGNYTLERLLIAENDVENADFLTFFKTNHWVVVDGRGRRDSSKAHYDDFCLDRYYHGTRHLGTIALICEQPEESYCKENVCFHQCCPYQHYFDEQKDECIFLENYAFNDWLDEFDATKPEELDFKNFTKIYGTMREHDLHCTEVGFTSFSSPFLYRHCNPLHLQGGTGFLQGNSNYMLWKCTVDTI